MVVFVIFWASLFAIIFFVLGVIFKAIASILVGLLSAIGKVLAIGGITFLVGIGLYLLYGIVDGIVQNGWWDTIGSVILFVIVIGICIAIFGGLGAAILEFVAVILVAILDFICNLLDVVVDFCENCYIKLLSVIIKNLEKC